MPRFEKKTLLVGAGALLAIVVAVVAWSLLRDDAEQASDAATGAVGGANDAVAGSELQIAMQAANVLYLDVGSYTNVNPATLESVEPSIAYVGANQPAGPGEVSVLVNDAQSLVLVTARPDGTCRALYQALTGARELVPPAPCAAANVPLGGGGVVAPPGSDPSLGTGGFVVPNIARPGASGVADGEAPGI
jgi:hypothetical protein